MEPITAGWMMATLLSGWIGNRGDFWLCKGFNKLHKRISENIDEPANHHIKRAVRKSYLKATLLAVEHLQKQRSRFSLTDRSWDNLNNIKSYIKDQIDNTKQEETYVRRSTLDGEYRDILFPKDATAAERMPELIQKLKDSIINELEGNRLRIESALKTCIYDGWKEGSKEMDFYKLTCAFFTQELKDNTELSSFIQTEYLDHIATEVGDVSLKVDDIKEVMQSYYEMYKDLLRKVDEILITVVQIDNKIDYLTEKTEQILNSVSTNILTRREITLSEEYQEKLNILEHLNKEMITIRSQIEGLNVAIAQVDVNTKGVLQQNISNLESQLMAKGSEKDLQENELNEFIRNVISLAKQLYTTKDLDSERLKKARALFAEGKYEELDEVLNENEIDKDIELYKERGKMLANELTIKAQAILVNKPESWFEEADRLYAKAMAVIEDYNTTFNYAYFLYKHRQILKSSKLFEKVIFFCSNDEEKAAILNVLGLLQKDKNEYDKAEQSYQEALKIKRKLLKINPQTYLPSVGITLNNLGLLQKDKNEYDKAERSYQEALKIKRKLSKVNPQMYLSGVGMTLNNLGLLQKDKNEYDKAEQSYQEALMIYRKLVDVNPLTFLPYVAATLNNLAILQCVQNEYENAEKSFQEALEIRRKLSKANPQRYMSDFADTLNNLGLLQKDKNDYNKAEKYYKEALTIDRKLSEINPQTYLPLVGITLNNLANLQSDKNEYEKAEQSYEEALAIRRKLTEDNPQVYSIVYGDTCISLAVFYQWNFVDKLKSIFYARNALEAYAPFVPNMPHAVKWSKKAEDILAYWEKNE